MSRLRRSARCRQAWAASRCRAAPTRCRRTRATRRDRREREGTRRAGRRGAGGRGAAQARARARALSPWSLAIAPRRRARARRPLYRARCLRSVHPPTFRRSLHPFPPSRPPPPLPLQNTDGSSSDAATEREHTACAMRLSQMLKDLRGQGQAKAERARERASTPPRGAPGRRIALVRPQLRVGCGPLHAADDPRRAWVHRVRNRRRALWPHVFSAFWHVFFRTRQ